MKTLLLYRFFELHFCIYHKFLPIKFSYFRPFAIVIDICGDLASHTENEVYLCALNAFSCTENSCYLRTLTLGFLVENGHLIILLLAITCHNINAITDYSNRFVNP